MVVPALILIVMASVATSTAVWKPKVTSVALRSFSMVFGTPMTGSPFRWSAWAMFSDAADGDEGVDRTLAKGLHDLVAAVHRPPGAVRLPLHG